MTYPTYIVSPITKKPTRIGENIEYQGKWYHETTPQKLHDLRFEINRTSGEISYIRAVLDDEHIEGYDIYHAIFKSADKAPTHTIQKVLMVQVSEYLDPVEDAQASEQECNIIEDITAQISEQILQLIGEDTISS